MLTTLTLPARELPRSLAAALTPPNFRAPQNHAHEELCHELICSHPAHQVHTMQPVLSLVTHAVAITGLVYVSAMAPAAVQRAVFDTTLVQLFQPAAAPKPPDPAIEKLREERAANLVVVSNPPPQGFQTIDVVAEIPKDLPPVDLNAKAFDPRDFSGRGVEGGIADGVVGGTGKVSDLAASYAKGGDDGAERRRIYSTSELADPAEVISQPVPVYPKIFQEAGISGVVDLQYVIDTLGRVEPGSVKILSTTHEPFADAAIKAIRESKFRPGRQHGDPIRQLVQQRVRFEAPDAPPGF